MYSKKHVIAAAPLVLSLTAFTQEALAITDITACRNISTSGSFRLTRNLSTKEDCLVVTANEVEIDLRGHTIRGNGAGFGVRDQNGKDLGQFAITLRNGTIANFQTGVSLQATEGAVVEQLRVVESGDFGITLFSGWVRSNVVFDVKGTGINVRTAGVVSDNFVSRVSRDGIVVGTGSSVVGNSVRRAEANGLVASCPSRVTDNGSTGTGNPIGTIGFGCSLSGNAGF